MLIHTQLTTIKFANIKLCLNLFCQIKYHSSMYVPLYPHPLTKHLLLTDSFSTSLFQHLRLFILHIYPINAHIAFAWVDAMNEVAKHVTILSEMTPFSFSFQYQVILLLSDLQSQVQRLETQLNNELRRIRNKPSFWARSSRSDKRLEIFISRFKIEHTHLTHSYFL